MLRFIACCVLVLFSGCAALSPPPPAPQSALPKGSKVGLLVELDSEIEHMHVGTTVFNNFSYKAQLPWNLQLRAQSAFTKSLTDAGLVVVDLKSAGIDGKSLGQLVIKGDKGWTFNPSEQAAVNRLRNDLGLSAVVSVSTGSMRVRNECSQFGCAETYMNQSGLFTRGFFASTRFFAVPAIYTSAYRLSEPSNLSVYEPLRSVLDTRIKLLKDFADPKDLHHLTDAEFAPVADSIAATVDAMSDATAQVLAVSAKVP